MRSWYAKNKDRVNSIRRDRYSINKEPILALNRKYKQDNHQKVLAHKRTAHRIKVGIPDIPPELDIGVGWKSNNKEYARLRERLRYENDEEYKIKNILKAARRRTIRVPWANKEMIRKIYEKARYLTKTTGIKYVVDHIIPIKHPQVCGLHVENNLRVITETENARKHNSLQGIV